LSIRRRRESESERERDERENIDRELRDARVA